jgi:hypothetical protein
MQFSVEITIFESFDVIVFSLHERTQLLQLLQFFEFVIFRAPGRFVIHPKINPTGHNPRQKGR